MKIKFKKYASGGYAPFASVYTPVQVTNPYQDPIEPILAQLVTNQVSPLLGVSSKSTSKTTTESQADEALKLLKDMKGLDSDVSTAVSALSESAQRSAIFGTSSSMITDYYRNLQLVNQVKQSKEEYDNAYTEAKSKQGLGEIATTSQGGVIVKNKEGKLLTITPEEFAKDPSKYSVQTNGNILYERAHNKTFAGQDSLTTIVQESSSMKEIQSVVKDLSNSLGHTNVSLSEYTKNQGGQFQNGIQILKQIGQQLSEDAMSMDGVYKLVYNNKNNKEAINYAVQSIYGSLNEGQKALLKMHSDGTSKGAVGLIMKMVAKGSINETSIDPTYQTDFNPDGSPKEKDSNGSTKGSGGGGSTKEPDMSPIEQWWTRQGEKQQFTITGVSAHGINTKANIMPIVDKEGKALGVGSTLQNVSESSAGGALDFANATMGNGAKLNANSMNMVLVDASRMAGADLPIDTSRSDGVIAPNIDMLQKIDAANNQLKIKYNINADTDDSQLTPQQKKIINQIYVQNQLPVKYGNNGKTNQLQYRRFAMVQGTTSETAFTENPNFGNLHLDATDQARKSYIQQMKTKPGMDKFQVDDGWLFGSIGRENVYQGTIFLPVTNNYNTMRAASGNTPKISEARTEDRASDEMQRLINNGGIKLNTQKLN